MHIEEDCCFSPPPERASLQRSHLAEGEGSPVIARIFLAVLRSRRSVVLRHMRSIGLHPRRLCARVNLVVIRQSVRVAFYLAARKNKGEYVQLLRSRPPSAPGYAARAKVRSAEKRAHALSRFSISRDT